ncbi:HAD-IIIA family hydrolase [Paraburkholderia graminis]|uniref:HAD-IIIA family hydrolase n=1 Tax=Paraburkholderia graminis TaxID=60548 RepID=UPI0038B807DE
MRQAVILAGGKGTRLRERLGGRPKPLVDFDGVPLLGRQIVALREEGFDDLLILVNHEAEQIAHYCRGPEFAGLRIRLLDDGEPRGTAGALTHAFDHLAERFLVVYGDTIFDLDLDAFWREHERAGAAGTLLLHPNDHPFDSDLVALDDAGYVSAFHAPPHDPDGCVPNQVNAALYVLERDAIAFWRDAAAPSDIARDMFPAMLKRGERLFGYVSFEYIKDIGTPARLDKAIGQFRSGFVRRARRDSAQQVVFLDRDGTINEPHGFLARAEDFRLIDGAGAAIKRLNAAEYRVVVVTNQPVIARGEASTAELRRIHARMDTLLGRSGAFVDALYYCPHHPDSGFPGEVAALKIRCDCRKPGTGLIDQAKRDMHVDIASSWLVGDSTADMLAAERAGLRSVLVSTGEGGRDGKYVVEPDFQAANLADAADLIVRRYPAMAALVEPIAARIAPGTLIVVGGLARQGKSTVAAVLRHALAARGTHAVRLSLDGWSHDEAQRGDGVLGRYDLDAFQRAIGPWLAGADASFDVSVYDRLTRCQSVRRATRRLASQDVPIVEGVVALHGTYDCARPVVRVFVTGDEDARHRRVVADLQQRGSAPAAAEALYGARQRDEAPLVEAGHASADFVISLDSLQAASPALHP